MQGLPLPEAGRAANSDACVKMTRMKFVYNDSDDTR